MHLISDFVCPVGDFVCLISDSLLLCAQSATLFTSIDDFVCLIGVFIVPFNKVKAFYVCGVSLTDKISICQ